jgi:DME family drug/metabolite transporter
VLSFLSPRSRRSGRSRRPWRSRVPLRSGGGATDILLAACLWGTTGTVRTFAPPDAGPVTIGAARIILGGLVLFVLATRGAGLGRLLGGGRGTWALLALGAVSVAVYQTAFFAAVARTGVATGTVVTIGSAPAFTGVLSLLTGQGGPSRRWTLATAGAVTGCALLVSGGRAAGVEPVGVLLALLSGLTYAGYATVAGHLISRGEDGLAVVGALFGGAGVLLLPVLLSGGPGTLLTGPGLLVTLYLGVVTTGLGYALYARGLRTTPVTVATTLGLAEPAVAALLGLAVLDEHLGGLALAGLATLAGGIVLIATGRTRPRSPGSRVHRDDTWTDATVAAARERAWYRRGSR